MMRRYSIYYTVKLICQDRMSTWINIRYNNYFSTDLVGQIMLNNDIQTDVSLINE